MVVNSQINVRILHAQTAGIAPKNLDSETRIVKTAISAIFLEKPIFDFGSDIRNELISLFDSIGTQLDFIHMLPQLSIKVLKFHQN